MILLVIIIQNRFFFRLENVVEAETEDWFNYIFSVRFLHVAYLHFYFKSVLWVAFLSLQGATNPHSTVFKKSILSSK